MTREAMENRLVNYTAEDGIAVIELNDPPANTYSYEMMQQLEDQCDGRRGTDDGHRAPVTGHPGQQQVERERVDRDRNGELGGLEPRRRAGDRLVADGQGHHDRDQ